MNAMQNETQALFEYCMNQLPEYFFRNGVLSKENDKGNLELSNFLPIPISEVQYDNGEEIERSFQITALKQHDGELIQLPPVTIKAADLPSMNWVAEHWGFRANIYPPQNSRKDYLRYIIFELGQHIASSKTVYTHTGWRQINGEWCFLFHGGVIGNQQAAVELGSRLERYQLRPSRPVTMEESVETVMKLFRLAKPEIMYPLVGLAFLSPLNEFLRQSGHEPTFLVYLLGRTQSRKSTLAALILSFFGNFTASSLPSSFKDTDNAVEKKNHALKDVLTVIDDYHPVSSKKEKQQMDKLAQSLSRGYGDRTGRDRMKADTSFRQGYPPRGNAIITGEDFPEIGQSGAARNFIVEVRPNDIPANELLTDLQEKAAEGVLVAFMSGYISWLSMQVDILPQRLHESFLMHRDRAFIDRVQGLGRTGDILAWLQIGMEYFIDYLRYLNMMDDELTEQMKEKSWKVLCRQGINQLDRAAEEKPTEQFLTTLRELIENKTLLVQRYPAEVELGCDRKGELVGYEEEGVYYLFPKLVYQCVSTFFRQQDLRFPLSQNQLQRMLGEEGISLIEQSGGRNYYTRQKQFGPEQKGRYLAIPKDAVFPAAEERHELF